MHGSISHSYSVFTLLSFTVAYTINNYVQAPLFQSLERTTQRADSQSKRDCPVDVVGFQVNSLVIM